MARYDFLVETYRAERLKILSAWSQAPDAQDGVETGAARAHPAGAHGASVRQRASLHATMLGIAISLPMLRAVERRLAFLQHDAATSTERLAALEHKPEDWFEEEATFFDVRRSRVRILTRRLIHSAHHRAQLTTYIRFCGVPLYSTYGPTADTDALPVNRAKVAYRYRSVEQLLVQSWLAVSQRPFRAREGRVRLNGP